MGTCIDYSIRFGGANSAKTSAALAYIRDIQAETAEFSGKGVCDFSDEPLDVEGFRDWHFYSKSGDQTAGILRDKLIQLTVGDDFTFWFYWECTDGSNESALQEHRDGNCVIDLFWNTGVLGFNASLATAALQGSSDVNAAHRLITLLLSEGDGEWGDDEYTLLDNSLATATTLADAFEAWPSLLQEAALRLNFEDVFQKVSTLLDEVEDEAEDIDKLQGLLAALEAKVLEQGIATCGETPPTESGKRL